jgi:hypothetical protein
LLSVGNIRPPAQRNGAALGHVDRDPFGINELGDFGLLGEPTPGCAGPAWEMKRWDLDRGLARVTLPGHAARLECAAFSPPGDRVAVGAYDDTVSIWDTDTGRALVTVPMSGRPRQVAFGPRGAFLAVLVTRDDASAVPCAQRPLPRPRTPRSIACTTP